MFKKDLQTMIQEAPQRRSKRKRKISFDSTTILTNAFLRSSLEDTSDILRIVSQNDGSSRLNKKIKGDEIFHEPLLTGLSVDLGTCFRHDYIFSRSHSLSSLKLTKRTNSRKMKNVWKERVSDDEEEEMIFLIMAFLVVVVIWYHSKYFMKDFSMSANDVRCQERRTWMRRLLYGPTCKDQIRMTPLAFQKLCNLLHTKGGLIASRNVTLEEVVTQFLHVLGHGIKNSVLKASFKRSGETISKQFHSVLKAVLSVGRILVQQYDRQNAPELVGRDIEKWKWFQGAVGSIDGTFVELTVPAVDQGRYRNRKGQLCTNVLGVCDPNLKFFYVLPGWEGSASDSRVLRSAIHRPNRLKIYSDHYYLVDAGYTNGPGFLAPYRNTRYHLKLWRGNTPQNYKELFNLRHSSARNSIERASGLLKKRWGILRTPSFYPLKTQIRIVNACCILHNFLRDEMPDDELLDQVDRGFENNIEVEDDFEHEIIEEEEDQITSVRVTNEWTEFRDSLAIQMFEEYQAQCHV